MVVVMGKVSTCYGCTIADITNLSWHISLLHMVIVQLVTISLSVLTPVTKPICSPLVYFSLLCVTDVITQVQHGEENWLRYCSELVTKLERKSSASDSY